MYNLLTFRLDALVIPRARMTTRASSRSIKLSTKNLCCFSTATATENDVTMVNTYYCLNLLFAALLFMHGCIFEIFLLIVFGPDCDGP